MAWKIFIQSGWWAVEVTKIFYNEKKKPVIQIQEVKMSTVIRAWNIIRWEPISLKELENKKK